MTTSKQTTTPETSEEDDEHIPLPPQMKYHAFLSHDWQRGNHERVSKINAQLKALGFKTWFDEDRMQGNIDKKMADGIEKSAVVVVFVTKCYMSKVNGDNAKDNCWKEFNLATQVQSANRMSVAVMETEVKDTKEWSGVFQNAFGQRAFH